jgi:hypothetical protein
VVVADRLKQGQVSAADVARANNTQPDATYRLMRGLSEIGVLHEHEDRKFSLTQMGECLRTDVPGSLAGMAKFLGEGWHSEVWAELMQALTAGKSPFEQVDSKPVFERFPEHPAESSSSMAP